MKRLRWIMLLVTAVLFAACSDDDRFCEVPGPDPQPEEKTYLFKSVTLDQEDVDIEELIVQKNHYSYRNQTGWHGTLTTEGTSEFTHQMRFRCDDYDDYMLLPAIEDSVRVELSSDIFGQFNDRQWLFAKGTHEKSYFVMVPKTYSIEPYTSFRMYQLCTLISAKGGFEAKYEEEDTGTEKTVIGTWNAEYCIYDKTVIDYTSIESDITE